MRLEPVANASSNERIPNSSVVHRMTSSARRERCIPTIASAETSSSAKSRSETASMLLSAIRENFNSFAT
jgi:hypothetical protein